MKRYILKKDLPDSKAGDVYIWNDNQGAYYKNGNTLNSYWIAEYVENNPDWFELVKPVVKPPLGLMPIRIHHEMRLEAILRAIERFRAAGVDIPMEWIGEKQTLESWLKNY